MAFPKVEQPLFTTTLPLSKKIIKHRQILVKEEKIILTAQASGDSSGILNAIEQLVQNCVMVPEDFDVSKIAAVDLEWLFVRLRAVSMSNIVELEMEDPAGSNKPLQTRLNLDTEIKVHLPAQSSRAIELAAEQKIGIQMKPLTFALLQEIEGKRNVNQELTDLELLEHCVDAVYEGDNVFPLVDAEPGEFQTFLNDLSDEQIRKVSEYLENQPYLYADVVFVDSKGESHTRRLKGMENFFVS